MLLIFPRAEQSFLINGYCHRDQGVVYIDTDVFGSLRNLKLRGHEFNLGIFDRLAWLKYHYLARLNRFPIDIDVDNTNFWVHINDTLNLDWYLKSILENKWCLKNHRLELRWFIYFPPWLSID